MPIATFLRAAPLLALAALAGCTTMADTPAGTPLSEVERRYGMPNHTCPLPDGGQRVIWSQQPYGQYAWGTDVTPDGRVGPIDSILTDEYFRRMRTGTWTTAQLLCTFGPPALTNTVGLGEQRHEVWSYRYREAKAWNSLMHIYLDEAGRVVRFHPGPDPLFDEDRWFGGFGGMGL